MNRLFTLLLLVLLGFGSSSCRYNDKELWNEIGGIKTELARINQEVGSLQTLVNALHQKKSIESVEESSAGHTITFSDGKTTLIKNGTSTPLVGIDLFESVYYWTVGGVGNWLTDAQGNKIPVSGPSGASPSIAVDADGYWTLEGVRIQDTSGNEIKASGRDGDSFFKSVTDKEEQVTFELTNGGTIVIPKTSAQTFGFEKPTDGRNYFVVGFGKRRSLVLKAEDIVSAEIMSTPAGWSATLNFAKKSIEVQAPAAAAGVAYSGGIITLVGINKSGATVFASVDVCASIDYTDPDGTFVVCEGNMTTANGMVVYYDKTGKEYTEVFEQANGGMEIGNVAQDIYMANGKIYLLTQNGNNMGGAGRLVVCDARTMRMEYADPLVFKTPAGKATWPQHLVITSETKGFIQYSEAGMEPTSGICAITLSPGKVQVGATVDGTFGKFTTVGAIKTRMVYSRGKIYAGCGHGVVIINPTSGLVEKRLDYPGQQVKGIAKGADGKIWFALAGTFTGSQNGSPAFTSKAKVVGIDHAGTVMQEQEMPASIKLPVATWSPAVGMCASFTKPYLYFVDTNGFQSNTATRYNYATQTFEENYVTGSETIYGVMGEHPTTKKLWVGKSSYVDSNIYVLDVSGATATEDQKISYPTQKGASPAGVDFAYRFTEAYTNK